jgi:hypothetical protein
MSQLLHSNSGARSKDSLSISREDERGVEDDSEGRVFRSLTIREGEDRIVTNGVLQFDKGGGRKLLNL